MVASVPLAFDVQQFSNEAKKHLLRILHAEGYTWRSGTRLTSESGPRLNRIGSLYAYPRGGCSFGDGLSARARESGMDGDCRVVDVMFLNNTTPQPEATVSINIPRPPDVPPEPRIRGTYVGNWSVGGTVSLDDPEGDG